MKHLTTWGLSVAALALAGGVLAFPSASQQQEPAAPALPAAKGATLGQALARLGADAWHKAGHKGKGIKVAVLDSGWQGWKKAQGMSLPAKVLGRSFRRDERLDARESQHGVLCGEIIHRIAPEAELLVANWEPESPEQFLEAVKWARQQGVRVISCSMIMPTWSDGEGGGRVHARLKELLGPKGGKGEALLFVSAGNTALRHWGGEYQPGREGWHEWASGEAANALRPNGGERVSVEVVHRPGARYEVVVIDAKTGEAVGSGRTNGHAAVARLEPKAGQALAVKVRRLDKADATKGKASFHLTVLGGKLGQASRAGSIPFPGDGEEAVAVAAVHESLRRQSYSSCGPGASGAKPDLCAVVPFPSGLRPGQPFSGTSAAAPQAAAAAALVWAREPGLTAVQVRKKLEEAARKAKPGHCLETGHGAVRLPALAAVK